jgi:hypothetical protein
MHALLTAADRTLPAFDAATKRRPNPKHSASPHEELTRVIVFQLAICGALINRNSIELAKGVAELLILSAEHARHAAAANESLESAEWTCAGCAASVPANFDLCWNCERIRIEMQPEASD